MNEPTAGAAPAASAASGSAADGRRAADPVLVTGAAGFIGFHVARALLERGDAVVGVDNLNDYYDPALKRDRVAQLARSPGFRFEQADLAERGALAGLFASARFDGVVHLAAQAGVRWSLSHPQAYVDANVTGTLNLLEQLRQTPVRHLVYASTSSVYGANTRLPFAVEDRVDDPVSLYAATKRAVELMCAVYARQFEVVATGLRFFTVYGPWGRPDMAPWRFTEAILAGRPIEVYNHGQMQRDFTYIDDVVEGVLRVYDRVPAPVAGIAHRLYNIGNERPEPLLRFIEVLAQALGRTPQMTLLPMQPGDVAATAADVSGLARDYGWKPTTPIEHGLPRFVAWYRQRYG